MSKQVELALVSLMPTYGSDLPASLVESASSLLAQSRHLASTLKAEEEIARLYACAHIACTRLKIALDLPTIEPRPPIPPRVYKRLYAHLDNILPNTSASGRRTRNAGSTPSSQSRPLPSRPEPSKESSLAQFRKQTGQDAETPTKSSRQGQASVKESDIYPWVQPVIRHLCAGSGHKKLAPSMLAGMESIFISGRRKTKDAWSWKNATALCAAIIFFVAMRARDIDLEQAIQPEIYEPTRAEIIDQLGRARQEVEVKGVEPDSLWEGWTDVSNDDFDAAASRIRDKGWLEADWYNGITDVINMGMELDDDVADGLDEEDSLQVQQQRADTMFQEKYNYLSEGRRAEYKAWKDATLMRIAELSASLEAGGSNDTQ
ncbi:origin recognition complex subunit 6 (ORC6) domain-containing protein [Trichoderma breve]|uniref:Origin recognition complex subunit 6 (ORC6) domain-containing protein n=1 Tax=Trichoderma breve TaxID=2034170 RepID=A0A9W9BCW6_9HYPO|nr:origin recognition complex subunit 6 (ORC6) domain-containing protein [Trichoderma breve]KAJ4857608.1 origin recognition complex subunit 6 (ORC6) domain-containing protein [Trichoderma breve]